MSDGRPGIVVFSSLFPNAVQPASGLFIRERMFRVGRRLSIVVVAPVPWFPLQGLIRFFKPNYRPMPPRSEVQDGVTVLHPRFAALPGLLRTWDGASMAIACLPTMRRLVAEGRADIIDAHFAYPDGYAATLLGQWLRLPVTITLRGTEVPHSRNAAKRRLMLTAVARAKRVFAVAQSLKRLVVAEGADSEKIRVVGNGVDTDVFYPVDRNQARTRLGLPVGSRLLISVGALVERKGFHRVIECLPELCREFPDLLYLIVGGSSPEGDCGDRLRALASRLGVERHVRFLGVISPRDLGAVLSAADVFVLATSNEGWANVFLEAMACGLPVVTTDVGGNPEVVCDPKLGIIVPFGDGEALTRALAQALRTEWDRGAIIAHARDNDWSKRVEVLLEEFTAISREGGAVADAG